MMFDADGYPTEEALDKARLWPMEVPYEESFRQLLEYVRKLWKYPDYFREDNGLYYISTGGWSGNEDVLNALEENALFWMVCWVACRTGGHYIFALPSVKHKIEVRLDVRREGGGMTITIPKETMLQILWGDSNDGKIIEDTICGTSRWSVQHSIIFRYQGKFYSASYQVGATETQDEGPWEFEDEVKATEVQEEERLVKVWVPV